MHITDVIIPVLNEQNAVGLVIDEIPKNLVRKVIVVDNGSTDDTTQVAREKGATVLSEQKRGYGNACLCGMKHIAENQGVKPDIVVFLDGDHSDFPEQMTTLIQEVNNGADLVIGSRALGKKEKGSMTPQQIFGNWLATFMIRCFYGVIF